MNIMGNRIQAGTNRKKIKQIFRKIWINFLLFIVYYQMSLEKRGKLWHDILRVRKNRI